MPARSILGNCAVQYANKSGIRHHQWCAPRWQECRQAPQKPAPYGAIGIVLAPVRLLGDAAPLQGNAGPQLLPVLIVCDMGDGRELLSPLGLNPPPAIEIY